MNLTLVKLTEEYKEQLNEMMEEWHSAETAFSPSAIRRNDYRDFKGYLEHLEDRDDSEGRVPDSVYFCLDLDTGRFVGAVDIRHKLTASNCRLGGHIADGVRPSMRRRGIATAMIDLALDKCRELGMKKVLMTCDPSNTGSVRSIEKNGGVFERLAEEEGECENRYWITLEEEKLETDRLILRRMMPSDAKEACSWSGDEEICMFLKALPVLSTEEMEAKIERMDPNSETDLVMILRRKEDGAAVGTVAAFYGEGIWNLAYTIRRADWGKGYATEAAAALMEYCIKRFQALRFEAECAEENIGSEMVMKKLGMRFERLSSYSKRDKSRTFVSKIYGKDVLEDRPLCEADAKEICTWRYEPEYASYNFSSWEECKEKGWELSDREKRERNYFGVYKEGVLIGFYHLMERGDHFELGLGLAPSFCGKGFGNHVIRLAVQRMKQKKSTWEIRLYVRTFNKRAIRCYEKAGFVITGEGEVSWGDPGDSFYRMELLKGE